MWSFFKVSQMDISSQLLEPSRLTIEGELVISRAHELKAALMDGFGERMTVELDLSKVSAIDISGLQVLCSAHRTALTKGGDLRISAMPTEIALAVRNSGFARRVACLPDMDRCCLWNVENTK
jgi:anti-anti-sigma factor